MIVYQGCGNGNWIMVYTIQTEQCWLDNSNVTAVLG